MVVASWLVFSYLPHRITDIQASLVEHQAACFLQWAMLCPLIGSFIIVIVYVVVAFAPLILHLGCCHMSAVTH